ncbi:MAG: hypothetical protein ABIR81_01065 [Ginsengibacter sp.]
MEPKFYIVISMRTVNGFESLSKFYLGSNKDFAYDIFQKLSGDDNVTQESILHMELMETRHELPLNLNLRCCTLEELGQNCKIIIRELFKYYNLQ